ncbi:phosphoribosylglycinamide formyltransferase [Kocuria dechangensis]|uniref:Phosphoribosylglycinamide formyltransferase n=1 Tax=Kocuria dechangensis TaxID=1176249 RepID=A0A917GF52_9MICC|nr:phosphoribosylglycinamide formyltransferase [Kocuria dechangensis]GGG42456.1 phosphoribosylglycinamide formyltransferase [Kocuria dechangensis]
MRIVVMVSGSGTNLQAVLDAVREGRIDVEIAAVGADKPCRGLERAEAAGIETFVVAPREHPDRARWNRALERAVAAHAPDRVLFAGFMRIVDAAFVEAFSGRIINTHPSLLPSFPGAHAVRDALAHGVKVTGVTVHEVVADVDAGPILAQAAVPVLPGDTEEELHERIKTAERALLVDTLGALAREGALRDAR